MKKALPLLIGACLVFTFSGIAQATFFQKAYGGSMFDEVYSFWPTADTGYIACGYSASFGGAGDQFYLLKTNLQGDTLWTKIYGNTSDNTCKYMQPTADGGFIMIGSSNAFGIGFYEAYLIKTNAIGDTSWTSSFPYGDTLALDYAVESGQQTADQGYIVVGETEDLTEGSIRPQIALCKTDATGHRLWTKYYGGTGFVYGDAVQQTSDGYIIAGSTNSFGAGGYDVYLVKTNTNGDSMWTRTYGGSGDDRGASVRQTNDGGYIISGSTNSFGLSNIATYLIKTNSSGDTLWTKILPGSCGNSVKQTADYGYITTGPSGTSPGEIILVKTNANGNELWHNYYGGYGAYTSNDVHQTIDGGYIVGGAGYGSTTYIDAFLLKTDAAGNAAVQDLGSYSPLHLAPNPAADFLRVSGDFNPQDVLSVTVTDIIGRQLSISRFDNATDFSVRHLVQGIYQVQIKANETVYTGRFVKQ